MLEFQINTHLTISADYKGAGSGISLAIFPEELGTTNKQYRLDTEYNVYYDNKKEHCFSGKRGSTYEVLPKNNTGAVLQYIYNNDGTKTFYINNLVYTDKHTDTNFTASFNFTLPSNLGKKISKRGDIEYGKMAE